MPAARCAAGTLQHRSLICPSLVRSSRTGSPRIGSSRIGSSSTVTPGIGSSSTVTPGIGSPGIGTPGIGSPGIGSPGIGSPGIGSPLDTTIRSAPDDTFDSDAPFDAYRADPAQHSWLHATDTQLHRQLPTAKQQRDSSRQLDILDINGSLYPTEQCRRSKLHDHPQRRSPIDHDSHPEQQQWQSHHHGAHAKNADQQHTQPLHTDALHQRLPKCSRDSQPDDSPQVHVHQPSIESIPATHDCSPTNQRDTRSDTHSWPRHQFGSCNTAQYRQRFDTTRSANR